MNAVLILPIAEIHAPYTNWFYTNAPAAWVSAVVATITCIFVLLNRKKPNRIVVREIRNSSLIHIWEGVREKIKVTFEQRNIKALGQFEVEIFNEGSDVIQRPSISVTFPEKIVILNTSIQSFGLEGGILSEGNKATISLPYLNPQRDHNQVIRLSFLIDGTAQRINVSGTGEGWSIKHLPALSEKEFIRRVKWCLMALPTFVVAYGVFVQNQFGIGMSEISMRSAIAYAPMPLTIIILFVYIEKKLSKRRLRTRSRE